MENKRILQQDVKKVSMNKGKNTNKMLLYQKWVLYTSDNVRKIWAESLIFELKIWCWSYWNVNRFLLCFVFLKLYPVSKFIVRSEFKENADFPWGKQFIWELWKSSVQFNRSVMSNSLRPHGLQHARPPCPSSTSGPYSNSCPSSQWCHPTISASVIPFSSCFQYFPASGSFPMSQFFASSGQGVGASASVLVLPMNTQDWFPLGWTHWISLQSKGLSRVFSNTTVQKHPFFGTQLSL